MFPLTLRCTRVAFLLLKQFSYELETEAEVFFMLLIRIVSEEGEGAADTSGVARPPWLRVLAMEIMRGYALGFSLASQAILTDITFLDSATTQNSSAISTRATMPTDPPRRQS